MCAIGRYDTTRIPTKSSKSIDRLRISIVYTMLYWLIITPLCGPVVPDV